MTSTRVLQRLLRLSIIGCASFSMVPGVSAADAQRAALEVGLAPHVLATAGFNQTDAFNIYTAVAASTESSRLDVLWREATAHAEAISAAENRLRDVPTDAIAIQQLTTARSALAAATQEMNNLRSDLYELAMDGCPLNSVTCVTVLRDHAGWKAPLPYALGGTTDEDRRAIYTAWCTEQRCERHGEAAPDEEANLLRSIRSNTDVTYGEASLQANLAGIALEFSRIAP